MQKSIAKAEINDIILLETFIYSPFQRRITMKKAIITFLIISGVLLVLGMWPIAIISLFAAGALFAYSAIKKK